MNEGRRNGEKIRDFFLDIPPSVVTVRVVSE
jgi:hypothetical protein